MKKIQSASELLSVYGIALLIVAVVTVIIYVVTSLPSSTVPNFCTFSGYVFCRNIAIGSNDLVSRAILLFSNSQQYAVENAIPTINITNTGTFTGSCNPYYALPGGIFECVINFNKKMTPNQLSNGRINLNLTVCTEINNRNCGLPQRELYSGRFNVHISPIVPPPRCTISLSGNSVIPYGTSSNLTANVKLFETNIAVSVENQLFSSNNYYNSTKENSIIGKISGAVTSLQNNIALLFDKIFSAVAYFIVYTFILPAFSLIITGISIRELSELLGSEASFGKFYILG